MIVMMMAITPSLKASMRLFVIGVLSRGYHEPDDGCDARGCGVPETVLPARRTADARRALPRHHRRSSRWIRADRSRRRKDARQDGVPRAALESTDIQVRSDAGGLRSRTRRAGAGGIHGGGDAGG